MKLCLILFIPFGLSLQVCDHKSCDACLRDPDICAWCYENNFNTTKRCIPAMDIPENWCPKHIMNPNSTVNVVKNLNFSATIGNIVQMKPQILNIDIRPGSSVDFKFSSKGADNYPVDLYFLFDGSMSMIKIRNETAYQIEDMYNMMRKITNNIVLGMGLFIEKNAIPFTLTKNSTLAYSFQNRLKLSSDLELFQKVVKELEFGTNYDPPEAVLDALAQVLTCKEEIGWRKESTKIVVVITNQPYHAAGDGKYAGILQPYDGKCYLKEDKYYKELQMDYPSVSIINKLAADNQIIVLFAVEKYVIPTYKVLSSNIRGSKCETYSKKLTKILKNIYKNIKQTLKLDYNIENNYQKYFKISFNPDCLNYPKSDGCKIQEHEEKEITGTITLLEYVEAKNITIDIIFEGLSEKLQINVNVIKDCDCMKQNMSEHCNRGGTLNCGVCECYDDRYGEKCHNPNDFSACITSNSTAVCSNHGHCYQGKCTCKEGYEGDYCECKAACPQGADDRCKCVCGACKCKPGWGGSLCKCPSPPDCGDDNACSGLGSCVCGKCKCQDTANWDARTKKDVYCQVSCSEESCHERQCLILEIFILAFLKGDTQDFEDNINIVMEKNLTLDNSYDSWYFCPQLRIDVGCYTRFMYSYSTEKYEINVKVQSDFDYAETYYLLGGVSLLVLILIGLATLIAWKYFTNRRDRLEFERFKKELAENEIYNNNPIFQAATHTFNNPTFGQR